MGKVWLNSCEFLARSKRILTPEINNKLNRFGDVTIPKEFAYSYSHLSFLNAFCFNQILITFQSLVFNICGAKSKTKSKKRIPKSIEFFLLGFGVYIFFEWIFGNVLSSFLSALERFLRYIVCRYCKKNNFYQIKQFTYR